MSTVVSTGKTLTIRARWHGPPPKVGDYLMSDQRPRGSYRILEVELAGEHARGKLYRFICERASVEEATGLAESGLSAIHSWKWDPRTKVGAGWGSGA